MIELKFKVRCVVDARNVLGESPVWSVREQCLYWVDILGRQVHRWQPASGQRRSWSVPTEVGSIGLRSSSGLIVALRSELHLLDADTGALQRLCRPQDEPTSNRLNDGKVSPDGRFWIGTMDDRPDKEPVGNLYRVDTDGSIHCMVSGLKVSNGLAWSPDGRTMYHSDSRAAMIWQYDHDPATGVISERRVFATMDPAWGRPDGAAIDTEGCYWSAGVGAGRLNKFDARGRLVGWLQMPVTHPTMPCFGGPDMKTMYITSMRDRLSQEQLQSTPEAGGIFAVDVDVPGVAIGTYRS